MKKLFVFTIIMIAGIMLMAKPFTLMIYICGDNNLSGAMNGDIDEIENAYGNLTGNLDIVLCVDGSASYGGYDDEAGNHSDTRYYHLSGGGSGSDNTINETSASGSPNSEENMADPQTLIDFVDWADANYPADEYGLIIWNHGAGWGKDGMITKGGVSDDTDGDFMSGGAGEWRAAIEGARAQIKQDFYFIGHDLCVMAYMEVLWDEYDMAEMIVGSEANEPYDGWYYNNFITSLATSSPSTHAALGGQIVADYADYYSSSATMTYNVINDDEYYNGITENQFLALRDHIVWLAYYLITDEGGRDDTDVQSCIDAAVEMSSGTFYEDFKDVWDFCDNLANYSKVPMSTNVITEANAVKSIIDAMNPDDWQTGFTGSHGLGIYLPDDDNIYYFEEPYDASTHPWGGNDATQWTDFIYGYTTTTTPSNMSTDISEANATLEKSRNEITVKYSITGDYSFVTVSINDNVRTKLYDRSGSYTAILREPGEYNVSITAYKSNGENSDVLSKSFIYQNMDPVIRNGIMITDGFYNNVQFYSLDGRSIQVKSSNFRYDLNDMNKGMYFVKIGPDTYKLLKIDNSRIYIQ